MPSMSCQDLLPRARPRVDPTRAPGRRPRARLRRGGAGGRVVAFTCVGALGICSDGYSVPYLASWAERSDLAVLEQTAGLIDRLASRIENAVL